MPWKECSTNLNRRAHSWLDLEKISPDDRLLKRAMDVRYVNQGFELTVAVAAPCTAASLATGVDAFHQLHERLYTFSFA
jgi:N-methylhydantoinase A/oxoprolinase/acetone carboxylase beta subunit